MSSEPGLAVAGKPLVVSAHSSPLNYCIDGPVGKGMGATSSRSTMGWSVLVLAELQCFSWRNTSQFVYSFGWFPECCTHIWVLFDFISCVLGREFVKLISSLLHFPWRGSDQLSLADTILGPENVKLHDVFYFNKLST